MTKKKPDASRGRPPVPIERHPERFEIACWRAFTGMGLDSFPAARLAWMVVKGGPITRKDIEGALNKESATIPLPPFDPDDPDKGLRQLAEKAKRQRPSKWLVNSVALIQGLIIFIFGGNVIDMKATVNALNTLGWRSVTVDLADRALKSNPDVPSAYAAVMSFAPDPDGGGSAERTPAWDAAAARAAADAYIPPSALAADPERLSPRARRLLARLRQKAKNEPSDLIILHRRVPPGA